MLDLRRKHKSPACKQHENIKTGCEKSAPRVQESVSLGSSLEGLVKTSITGFQQRNVGLIPGYGTKIPHASGQGQKVKIKQSVSEVPEGSGLSL